MDFGIIELDRELEAFWLDLRLFLDRCLTDEVLEDARRSGDGFHAGFHRALGSRGWVAPMWPRAEGGAALSALQTRILALELWYRGAPDKHRPTTVVVADSLRGFAEPDLLAEILAAVSAGALCLCIGITEPDCGSDAAAVKTRAVRDGDDWIINGTKMFTSNAHNSGYCYLVARTNPEVPKHKGLTVFLVPMDSPGIEIRPVQTLGGERTNMVFYDEVRVMDRYRVGPVDGGWGVLAAQLAAEHAMTEESDVRSGFMYATTLVKLFDAAVHWANEPDERGVCPIDDAFVRHRLARVALESEVASITPEPMQRVNSSELLIRAAADVVDLIGPRALLPYGAPGAAAGGLFDQDHRWAQTTAIYGGTTDIQRNIIAEQYLGLPRLRIAPDA